MSTFHIKEYGRMELASIYSPSIMPRSAWRRFQNWMEKSPDLLPRLYATGYDTNQRIFTPIQVRIIVECLGEP